MYFVWALMSLTVFLLGGQSKPASDVRIRSVIADPKPPSCIQEYEDMGNHTMCYYNDDPSAKDFGVSEADRAVIVNKHNEYRRNVDPTAEDMQMMYWNEKMAKIAQKYAQTCRVIHDSYEQRRVPKYGIQIGQNMASSTAASLNWTHIVYKWHNETHDFQFAVPLKDYGNPVVGHFTAEVWGSAAGIGCGAAKCSGKWYAVCNYAYANFGDITHPYKNGSTCAACPDSCTNNLCDCDGKICRNKGTLDLNTCTCDCVGVYKGSEDSNCSTATCDEIIADPVDCNVTQSMIGPYCNNVDFFSKCPISCKSCTEHCPGQYLEDCQNGGTLNDECTCTCTSEWTGDQCEKYDCTGKEDAPYCTSWPQTYCTDYSNVPFLCPFKCNLC